MSITDSETFYPLRDKKSDVTYPGDVNYKSRGVPVAVALIVIIFANQIQVLTDWFPSRSRFLLWHACLMVAFSIGYLLLRIEHHRLRTVGYSKLYAKGNCLLRSAFILVAHTNALLAIIYEFFPPSKHESWTDVSSRAFALSLLILGETIMVCWLLCLYLSLSISHNRTPKGEPVAHRSNLQSIIFPFFKSLVVSEPLSNAGVPGGPHRISVSTHDEPWMRDPMTSKGGPSSRRDPNGRYEEQIAVPASPSDHVDMLTRDQDIRALRQDRDRLRSELQKMTDDFDKYTKATETIRKEHGEQLALLAKQKKKLRQLQKENQQLAVLVEVHKESNSNAQKLIESLAKPGVGSIPHHDDDPLHDMDGSFGPGMRVPRAQGHGHPAAHSMSSSQPFSQPSFSQARNIASARQDDSDADKD